jgi:hypothetical protein
MMIMIMVVVVGMMTPDDMVVKQTSDTKCVFVSM